MELLHHSQASNFISTVNGGVDPRTGLFGVNIPIAHLIGNDHMGPELLLTLSYNPLNYLDSGYGLGFSDNLTRYNTETNILTLFTGQSYHVKNHEKGEAPNNEKKYEFSHAKPTDFKFIKKGGNFWVVYKTGVCEKLASPNRDSIEAVHEIYAPSGHRLTFEWERIGNNLQLKKVKDASVTLLSVFHQNENIDFNIWPDSVENYQITLEIISELLNEVTICTKEGSPELKWILKYDQSCAWGKILTKITTPTGLAEEVRYKIQGHELPISKEIYTGKIIEKYVFVLGGTFSGYIDKQREKITIKYFPHVEEYTIFPGGDTPEQVITYEFSVNNFLGFSGKSKEAVHGQDYLYNVKDAYEYISKEIREYAGKRYIIERHYNKFHLLEFEYLILVTPGPEYKNISLKRTVIDYYADVKKSFDKQNPQFQMPKSHSTRLWNIDGNTEPKEILWKYEYNEYCNLTSITLPDKTRTEIAYYNVDGENEKDAKCPRESNGFQRFIKEKMVCIVEENSYKPKRRIKYKYKELSAKRDDSSIVGKMILLESEKYYSCVDSGNDVPLKENKVEYYDTVNAINGLCLHGRVSKREFSLFENKKIYSDTEDYIWSKADEGKKKYIKCETTFTGGKDELSVNKEQHWSLLSYRLIFEKDAQNNITEFEYDKMGHLKSRVLNPNSSKYKNEITHEWSFSSSGVPLSVVHKDDNGNKFIIHMDGLGRLLKKFYSTNEYADKLFKMEECQYNELGQLDKIISFDYVDPNRDETPLKVTTYLKYDDWGNNISLNYNNGMSVQNIIDPIKNQSEHKIVFIAPKTHEKKSTGIIRKKFDVNSQLIEIEKYKSDGKTKEGHWGFKRDGLGRLIKLIENNYSVSLEYDDFDRVVKQTLVDDTIIKRKYENSLPVEIFVSKREGNEYLSLGTQKFDSLGRIIETSSGGRKVILSYEGASPVPAKATYGDGKFIEYEYIPELNNVVGKIISKDVIQSFEYDKKNGWLTKATEEEVNENIKKEISFEYTKSGQLKKETFSFIRKDYSESKSASYCFSIANRPTYYKGVNGFRKYYNYDEYCRLIYVGDNNTSVRLEYDDLGRHIGQSTNYTVNNSNVKISLILDDFGREIERKIVRKNNLKNSMKETKIKINQEFCVRDKVSRKKISLHDGENLIREEEYEYEYDERGRLFKYCKKIPKTANNEEEITDQTYTWNYLGNLLEYITIINSNVVSSLSYYYKDQKDPCQLIKVSNPNDSDNKLFLEYDKRGRLIREGTGKKSIEKVKRELIYDDLGRIKEIFNNQVKKKYRYDPLNRLIAKEFGDELNKFYYKSDSLIYEAYPSGERKYNKLGKTCLGFSQYTDSPWQSQYTETGVDGKGSVIVTFQGDSGCNISYSPWGVPVEQAMVTTSQQPPPNTAIEEPRFNGEQWDAASTSYLLGNGYRAYRPDLMRFTAPDSWSPFGAGGINAYAYCEGDPVNLSDPSGHISKWGWASMIIGGISLALAPVTFGLSLEAGMGIEAALTELALTEGSDATAIMSGALEDKDPKTSAMLGWMSLGLGVPSLVMGTYSLGKAEFGSELRPNAVTVMSIGVKDFERWPRGYTNKFRGEDGVEAILLHGSKRNTNLIIDEFAVRNPETQRWEFFGDLVRHVPARDLPVIMHNEYNIDLRAGRGPVHLLSCYAKRGAAQELANAIGRPVIAYSKHPTWTVSLHGIEHPKFSVGAGFKFYDPRRLFMKYHQATPRTFWPE
ncbi:RHS repeat domain-containing protein [Photorhabdus luminescens]|uniref:RHS repeat domain-containing protein n=1 Tax=Photorhabdus luminescens TaxID=29488 RepID=UPI00223F1D1B|nr:RHS repeat-associated core domain-containing protein [Photorhabdus luminescens]MCW7761476.1 RHS repeat-associated core domain-containing protein [Photorhabdus luminescens subsp. venezuelensis]